MIYNELKQRGTFDFPIELYHLEKNHPRYEMTSHWHTELEIIRILSGEIVVRLSNNKYTARKGDILFVNPEIVHGATPDDNCIYECIVLHLDMLRTNEMGCHFFIDSLLNHDYMINEFISAPESDLFIATNRLFDAMGRKSSGYKFNVIGAIYQLFGVIIDNHLYSSSSVETTISADKSIARLKNVLSYMRTNFHRQITLDDMADNAGMSAKYFCSQFRKMTTKTPIEYLNSYRIERAARKLLNSDDSVTDIAFSCGFNDLSYFIKTFKSIKGITPSKFRKS
ncbi:MAG: helix-turn-helix domain-containing protein [Ruminococcaceae bacterium]|nr:helix-turn-helix domain-containing protein [Oscillospiraceae bacterium]